MKVANRICSLRKSKGISQEELANKIGVSRQAVSKWESEQSLPDIEKVILLSEYFEVTTDYLLKGTELPADMSARKFDANIFAAAGTLLDFIGVITSVFIWTERRTPISVAVGLIIMALGCTVFYIGQHLGYNPKKAYLKFVLINIWLVSLIPISCVFNFVQGILGGFGWNLSPIPELGNSIFAYLLCWVFYFAVCAAFDIIMLRRAKED